MGPASNSQARQKATERRKEAISYKGKEPAEGKARSGDRGTRAQKPAKRANLAMHQSNCRPKSLSWSACNHLLRKLAPRKGGSQRRRLPVVPSAAFAPQSPPGASAQHPNPACSCFDSNGSRAVGEQRTDLGCALPPKQNNNNQSRGK